MISRRNLHFSLNLFCTLHVNFFKVTSRLLFVSLQWASEDSLAPQNGADSSPNDCFCCSVVTGGAEHQAAVLHLPLAHLVAVAGVPAARRHPHLGLSVLGPGQVPLPHRGLLCYAHVRCRSSCNSHFVSFIIVSDGLSCCLLCKDSSEINSWPETSQSI